MAVPVSRDLSLPPMRSEGATDCHVRRRPFRAKPKRQLAVKVTGGSSGVLNSVVSTEQGRSVLQPSEASPGRDLKSRIAQPSHTKNVPESISPSLTGH